MKNSIEIVIKPNRSWLQIPWREIWEYRDLVFFLVRRDFIARYKQTILGPAWYVISPIITTIVFVIFSKITDIPTDGLPRMLFILCGMLGWNYFSSSLSVTASSFISNANLFGKVYFPRFIIPLADVVSNLIAFLIQFITFIGFWVYFKYFTGAGSNIVLHTHAYGVILLTIQAGMLALGVGLWFAALSAKYRDLKHLTGLIVQLWLYATPILYPLSAMREDLRIYAYLNPMTSIVESFKYLLLGTGTISVLGTVIAWAITFFAFFTGLLFFTKIERTFIDTV